MFIYAPIYINTYEIGPLHTVYASQIWQICIPYIPIYVQQICLIYAIHTVQAIYCMLRGIYLGVQIHICTHIYSMYSINVNLLFLEIPNWLFVVCGNFFIVASIKKTMRRRHTPLVQMTEIISTGCILEKQLRHDNTNTVNEHVNMSQLQQTLLFFC